MLQNDLLFKYIFSQELFLNDLINSLFKFLNKELKITFTSINAQEYILPNKRKIQGFYGDIVGILDNQNMISIEMYSSTFSKREYNKSLSYLCRLYSNQIKINKRYEDIKKVIGISFIKGNFRKQNENLINEYDFRQRVTNKVIDNGNLELYLVRLDLKEKSRYNVYEKRFIKWLRILNAKDLKEIEAIGKGDKIMEELKKYVAEWCEESAKDGLQRYIDDREFEAEERGEKRGEIRGIKLGEERGEIRGIKLGEKRGEAKGEQKTKIKIAKNLMSLNISMEDIVKTTGLNEKQLKKLI